MTRFYVTVSEVATYGVWVEAATEAEARDKAENEVANAITLPAGFGVELQGVSERDVERVETEAEYAK